MLQTDASNALAEAQEEFGEQVIATDDESTDPLESDEGAAGDDDLFAFLAGGNPAMVAAESDDDAFERAGESDGPVPDERDEQIEVSAPHVKVARSSANGRRNDIAFREKRKVYEKLMQLDSDTALTVDRRMQLLRQFAAPLGVKVHHRAQVIKWGAAAKTGGKRKRSERRKDLLPLSILDLAVKTWVQTRRSLSHVFTKQSITEKACELLNNDETIRAACNGKTSVSRNWVDRFMARVKFTSKNAKRRTPLTDEQLTAKASSFHTYIYRNISNVDGVMNIDEIPTSLSGNMTGKVRTVTQVTDSDVRVGVDSNAFKRCATIIAGAVCKRWDGNEGEVTWTSHPLKPIIILKGDPKQRRLLEEQYDPGALVLWSKCGVVSGKLMKEHVLPHLRREATALGMQRVLLIMDSASSHLTAEVTNSAWGASLPVAIIPAGCTSYLQWVDTHFASKLKHAHFKTYMMWNNRVLTASMKRQLLVRLVVHSYTTTLGDVTEDFRRLGYTSPASAEIRGTEYKFTPQVQSPEEAASDTERMLSRIRDSASTETVAPSPAPVRPVGRPPNRLQPPVGYGGDIRTFFAPRQRQAPTNTT